jgi:hypothetical protein
LPFQLINRASWDDRRRWHEGYRRGGIPSLRGEHGKKDFAHIATWIMNPSAPMPKLYLQPMTDAEVDTVALMWSG